MDKIAIDIGPFQIYWYAVFIVIGMFLAFSVARFVGKERGVDEELFTNLVVYGIVIGVIGARLYYVVFNFSIYSDNLINILKINEGGLAIHGGIIFGFSWGLYYCKKHKLDVLKVFDIGSLGFMIAQAIGRWGNFVNQEAHGGEVSLSFLQKLKIPNFIIEGMYIDEVYYHPTFLYESVWNLIGFSASFFLRKIVFKKRGDIFCFYLVWYSVGRLFFESLRTDSLYLGEFRVAQIVSIIGIIGGVAFYFIKNKYIIGGENESSNNTFEERQ